LEEKKENRKNRDVVSRGEVKRHCREKPDGVRTFKGTEKNLRGQRKKKPMELKKIQRGQAQEGGEVHKNAGGRQPKQETVAEQRKKVEREREEGGGCSWAKHLGKKGKIGGSTVLGVKKGGKKNRGQGVGNLTSQTNNL